ncbi:MAG: response regulator [Acidobacteriota bacterium]
MSVKIIPDLTRTLYISHISHLSTDSYNKIMTLLLMDQYALPIGPFMSEKKIRVLVVNDDEDMRVTLMDFISRLGVRVSTVGNLAEAERALGAENDPFDLVLTDLKLPGGSGMDVLKAAHTRSSDTLVTIITGYASLETAIEAIRLGAYDYITKPFTLDEIGVQVRNMIARVSLSKGNAHLSIRLQQLYEQVNQLQNERTVALTLQDDIRKQLQQNSLKLDLILATLGTGSQPHS